MARNMLTLETHEEETFDLVTHVKQHPVTVVVAFRGPWCPYCRAYWDDLADVAGDFQKLGAVVFGLSADKPKALRRFRRKRALPFTFVSDPKLKSRDVLGIRREKYHPMSSEYKKGAFLLPAVFVWTQDGKLAYQWRMKAPSFENSFGAANRPKPEKILDEIKKALAVAKHKTASAEGQPG
ncbi:AhpC/TSA family protein [Myxococcota bacterium]|nr:AhpC/TSA family protein [Myxococcota bacterium]